MILSGKWYLRGAANSEVSAGVVFLFGGFVCFHFLLQMAGKSIDSIIQEMLENFSKCCSSPTMRTTVKCDNESDSEDAGRVAFRYGFLRASRIFQREKEDASDTNEEHFSWKE